MIAIPDNLWQYLKSHGQEHVLRWWDQLKDGERSELLAQIQALDLDQLRQLYAQRDSSYSVPTPERIAPVPVARLDPRDSRLRQRGEEALRQCRVAVLLVAGGQGSRLGFEHPKGMYPIGPVTNKTLFQIHAEKVLALSRRYGKPLPFLIMTSHATHDETEAFFKENRYFGLPSREVFFFRQGTMPALDMTTGKLLLEAPGRLFTSPNGHGGTLTALAETGLLDILAERGIQHVFYFQVDNPLVKVADPLFLGHHFEAGAEVSSKIVPKEGPLDRLGNMVLIDGRCSIIEYSDLPEDLARQTDEQGRLRIWAGSPAIHIFSVDFLKRVTGDAGAVNRVEGRDRCENINDSPLSPERSPLKRPAPGTGLPFHVARKKVPYLDDSGRLVQPASENALKFEMFIFDVLPLADRWTVVETSRREEFVPLKNMTGPDSPEVVRQAISDLAADWLEQAGMAIPRRPDGSAAVPLEISPLYALDAEELAKKIGSQPSPVSYQIFSTV